MAFAGYYDRAFDSAAGRGRPVAKPKSTASGLDQRDHDALMELEFSEVGRDPRFLPGWYILPSIVGGLLVLTALAIR